VNDLTLNPFAAFGSDRWCADRLGKSLAWFRSNRERLEREGFPKKDLLLGLTHKSDVEAFLARRRKVADADVATATVAVHHTTNPPKEKLHEL
jgi:hypothetical protein